MKLELPAVEPFTLPNTTMKDQAVKIIEEAAELFEATKGDDDDHTRYEAMDVYQALCNYIFRKGWTTEQLEDTYKQVYASNKRKGRYNGEGKATH